MHYFETHVHISVTKRHIVRYESDALYGLCSSCDLLPVALMTEYRVPIHLHNVVSI